MSYFWWYVKLLRVCHICIEHLYSFQNELISFFDTVLLYMQEYVCKQGELSHSTKDCITKDLSTFVDYYYLAHLSQLYMYTDALYPEVVVIQSTLFSPFTKVISWVSNLDRIPTRLSKLYNRWTALKVFFFPEVTSNSGKSFQVPGKIL